MRIGWACAYTPLPLIDAAGCTAYRILPVTDAPDKAGQVIHDNMCPHVKRVLDRALAEDIPALDGVVMVNSCDSMRRLADAWRQVRPDIPIFLLDLPAAVDERAAGWVAVELERLRRTLEQWTGETITNDDLDAAVTRYDALAAVLDALQVRQREGNLPGGAAALQRLYNKISVSRLADGLAAAQIIEAEGQEGSNAGVPIHLFGNVIPDPGIFELLEDCGARVVSDDLCTGSRLIQPVRGGSPPGPPIPDLAASLLDRQPCARTFHVERPGGLAGAVVERTREDGAAGIIAYVTMFCDPYLIRMPAITEACAAASLPLLVLEGDCTLRSLGQQATRIEAFVEMLEVRT